MKVLSRIFYTLAFLGWAFVFISFTGGFAYQETLNRHPALWGCGLAVGIIACFILGIIYDVQSEKGDGDRCG